MYVETVDDLNRKYGNTFAFYKGQIVYITEFLTDEDRMIIYFHRNGARDNLHEDLERDLLQPIVFNSMFVNNSTLESDSDQPMIPGILVARNPRRQWRLGLCRDNTRISCPLINLYVSLGSHAPKVDMDLSYKLIKYMQTPVYPTLNEAISLLERYQCVALSSLFCIMLSSISRDRYLITNHFGFVAEATPGNIYVRHQPSWQEMRDYVRRTGQSIAIHSN